MYPYLIENTKSNLSHEGLPLYTAGVCRDKYSGRSTDCTPDLGSFVFGKADVIAVASLQAYPRGIERKTTQQEPIVEEEPVQEAITTTDSGPIRDWSNPPGYMGSISKAISTSKHKPLTPKKYHRPKSNRCYTF